MVKNTWERVWERVRAGKHVIVIGPKALPSTLSDLQVLYVNCEVLGSRGSVLDTVSEKLEQRLGEALRPMAMAHKPFESGLRQRLSGDMPG